MPKQRKQDSPTVPEWVVTYGDLMSLLLCFFILLAAFSELKKPEEYQRVLDAIREAFGYQGERGAAPLTDAVALSVLLHPELRAPEPRLADDVPDPNIPGRHARVHDIRRGNRYAVGAALVFGPGEWELSESMRQSLQQQVVPKIKGQTTRIDIAGHAFGLEDKRSGLDYVELAYKRAREVQRFLIEQGIEAERLVVEVVGDSEPFVLADGPNGSVAGNRRVQVWLTEITPQERSPNALRANEGS